MTTLHHGKVAAMKDAHCIVHCNDFCHRTQHCSTRDGRPRFTMAWISYIPMGSVTAAQSYDWLVLCYRHRKDGQATTDLRNSVSQIFDDLCKHSKPPLTFEVR